MARIRMEDKIHDYWNDEFYNKYDPISSYSLSALRSDEKFVKFESDLKNYIIKNHKKEMSWKVTGVMDDYIEEVIRGRWYEMEPYILNSEDIYLGYCEEVVKGRWLELEERLVREKDFDDLLYYANNIIKNRWNEFEKVAIEELKRVSIEEKEDIVDDLRRYCDKNEFRWPEFENYLLTGINYTKINKNISKDILEHVLRYSLEVVDGRWEEAEGLFIKRIDLAKRYLKYHKFRWPLYEHRIRNKPHSLYNYAREVLDGKLPEHLHNRMIMESMGKEPDVANIYFNFLKEREESVIRYFRGMSREEIGKFMEKILVAQT
jgi:hypothetical protein